MYSYCWIIGTQEMNRLRKYSNGWIVSTQEMHRLQNEFIWLNRRHTANESTAKVFIWKNRKHAGNESTAICIHIAESYARKKWIDCKSFHMAESEENRKPIDWKSIHIQNRRHAANESTVNVFIWLNQKTTGNESTAKCIHMAESCPGSKWIDSNMYSYGWIVRTKLMNRIQNIFIFFIYEFISLYQRHAGNESNAKCGWIMSTQEMNRQQIVFILNNRLHEKNKLTSKCIHIAES